MNNIIKISLTTLICSNVFAGTMGSECTPTNITTPCWENSWGFKGQALYLKPSYSLGALTQTFVPLASAVPSVSYSPGIDTYNKPNFNWGWGFTIEGLYKFNSGNDLDVNWYYYNHANTNIITKGSSPGSNVIDNLTSATMYSDVSSKLQTQWNAVNLQLGQTFIFGSKYNIHTYGGIQYTDIHTNVSNVAITPGLGAAVGANFDITSSSTSMRYSGVGPRIGSDLLFSYNNFINIYANGAASILIGTRNFSNPIIGQTTSFFVNNGGQFGPYYNTSSGSDNVIVPELEVKLGAAYKYKMSFGDLILDAGWLWVNYFNAHAATGNPNEITSDFGIQGLYFGLKV